MGSFFLFVSILILLTVYGEMLGGDPDFIPIPPRVIPWPRGTGRTKRMVDRVMEYARQNPNHCVLVVGISFRNIQWDIAPMFSEFHNVRIDIDHRNFGSKIRGMSFDFFERERAVMVDKIFVDHAVRDFVYDGRRPWGKYTELMDMQDWKDTQLLT